MWYPCRKQTVAAVILAVALAALASPATHTPAREAARLQPADPLNPRHSPPGLRPPSEYAFIGLVEDWLAGA